MPRCARVATIPRKHLWWERSLRSVANVTRHDVRDVLALASEIPLRPAVRAYPLEHANDALGDLRPGTVGATAVFTPRERDG